MREGGGGEVGFPTDGLICAVAGGWIPIMRMDDNNRWKCADGPSNALKRPQIPSNGLNHSSPYAPTFPDRLNVPGSLFRAGLTAALTNPILPMPRDGRG